LSSRSRKLPISHAISAPESSKEMTSRHPVRTFGMRHHCLNRLEKVAASKTSSWRSQMIMVGNFDRDMSHSSHSLVLGKSGLAETDIKIARATLLSTIT
jgi:hypothetical protein